MDTVVSTVLERLIGGGPGAGWILAVYLLIRLHQLTDRQHRANLDTVKALITIKTVLFARRGGNSQEGDDE